MNSLKQEAQDRAERAKDYARKFPEFSQLTDPWCQVEWQIKRLEAFYGKTFAPEK